MVLSKVYKKKTEKDHGIMNGEWLNIIERVIFLKVVFKLKSKYRE